MNEDDQYICIECGSETQKSLLIESDDEIGRSDNHILRCPDCGAVVVPV